MASHSKTALVSGAGTGVGRAVALALLKDGYRVALAGGRAGTLARKQEPGGGTGVGRAVARALLKDGYRVALAGRRKEMLEQTASQAGPAGKNTLVVPTDVGKPGEVQALFAKIQD